MSLTHLLSFLYVGGAQHDTVAAVTHILFTVTNPTTTVTSIESQLWLPESKLTLLESTDNHGKGLTSRFSINTINSKNNNGSLDITRKDSRNLILGHGSNLLGSSTNKFMSKCNGGSDAVYGGNDNTHSHPPASSSSLTGKKFKDKYDKMKIIFLYCSVLFSSVCCT